MGENSDEKTFAQKNTKICPFGALRRVTYCFNGSPGLVEPGPTFYDDTEKIIYARDRCMAWDHLEGCCRLISRRAL